MPTLEGLNVYAVALLYGAGPIGFENFYYQMKGGWDIER
jgi:hypothetical protein